MLPTRRSMIALTCLAAAVAAFVPSPARAADEAQKKPDRKYKVLVLTQSRGFVHQPVRRPAPDQLCQVEKVMQEIADKSGLFTVENTQDASIINADKLKDTDVLFFYTTGALPISDENWRAVLDWLNSGKGGFIGIHSATDTGWNYKGEGLSYTKLINGKFAGHPWNQGTPITVTAHDPSHPTVKMWGPEFDWKDEIYQYQDYDPKAVRVLQSLNFAKTARKAAYHVPVTWVREVGKGRLFYTNLGHTPATWDEPRFRDQIVSAVRWVVKLDDGSAEPNPDVQAQWQIHSFLSTSAAEQKKPAEAAAATFEKLKAADKAWLEATAERIVELRKAGRPNDPKAPNKADEQKDPAKYAQAVKNFEAEKASYQTRLDAYNAKRDALLAEIEQKAAGGTAAAK